MSKREEAIIRGMILVLAVVLSGHLPAFATFNTAGEKGVVRTISAKPMGRANMNVGTGISIFQSGSYVDELFNRKGEYILLENVDREAARMLSANLFLGLGLTCFWDAAMTLPFHYDWLGYDNVQDGGIGDLEFSSKFLYPDYSKRVFYQSYFLSTTMPTGMKRSGFFPRHPYFIEGNDTNPARTFYSSEYPTVKGLMLWTWDLGNLNPRLPVQVHLNFGGVVTSSIRHMRNTAIAGCAVEYTPLEILSLFVDLHSESRWSSFSTTLDPSNDPFFLSTGLRLTTPTGIYVGFVSDFSLSSHAKSTRLRWNPTGGSAKGYRYTTGVVPNYGIQFTLGWNGMLVNLDDDRDSIPNSRDLCPKEPEDYDGYQDDDGCPDYDNDGDGIPDSLDRCPNQAEDFDGFEDDDGCPDLDNDEDGVPDFRDSCALVKEDFDGFQDADGCPDYDNDGDGIPDSLDRCPNDPEDIDGFEDDDGCPDVDNDLDGVFDLKDRCPDIAGPAANDGCPEEKTKRAQKKKEPDFPRSQILNGIDFRKGTADLAPESFRFIDPILHKLQEYPEVEIEIHGHTESIGGYTQNMQLSQMRAETVRQYLVSKGVGASRLRAVGFGSSSPIADNRTAAGRAKNRRIEIIRVR